MGSLRHCLFATQKLRHGCFELVCGPSTVPHSNIFEIKFLTSETVFHPVLTTHEQIPAAFGYFEGVGTIAVSLSCEAAAGFGARIFLCGKDLDMKVFPRGHIALRDLAPYAQSYAAFVALVPFTRKMFSFERVLSHKLHICFTVLLTSLWDNNTLVLHVGWFWTMVVDNGW